MNKRSILLRLNLIGLGGSAGMTMISVANGVFIWQFPAAMMLFLVGMVLAKRSLRKQQVVNKVE